MAWVVQPIRASAGTQGALEEKDGGGATGELGSIEGGQNLESKISKKKKFVCVIRPARPPPAPDFNVGKRAPRDRRRRDKILESSDPGLASRAEH